MLRSLVSALFGRSSRSIAGATSTTPAPRFVPSMQSLEVREVPAVLAMFTVEPTFAATADTRDTASDAVVTRGAPATYLSIQLSDVLVVSYSS